MAFKTISVILAAGALAPAAVVYAQEDAAPLHERTALTDVPLEGPRAAMQLKHVALSIAVDPQARSITGDAQYRVTGDTILETLVFDFDPRFTVHGVALEGIPLERRRWAKAEGLLTIELPAPLPVGETADVRIEYAGMPHVAINPPWDGGFVWSRTEDGQPWIATAIQGEGCDLFWPCIDHSSKQIDALDLLVTVPNGLVAAGNGRLIGCLLYTSPSPRD